MNSKVPAQDAQHAQNAQDTTTADDVLAPAIAVHELLVSLIRHTPRDITLTSLSALGTLQREGPRRITELAASEAVTQPTVTALVASLVEAGLVERRRDPADGRVVLVAITEAGLATLRARREANAQAVARAVAQLSPEDAATLTASVPVIERLRALLEQDSRQFR